MQTQGLRVSAVALGFAADVAVTFAGGFAMALAATLAGIPDAAQLEAGALPESASLLLLSLAIGLAATALGGFVAARLARHAPLRHGLALGVLCVALGLLVEAQGIDAGPAWMRVAGYALTIPAALAGSALVRRRTPIAVAPLGARP